ncbi:succinyl-diaminopimelate desuccinylase [Cryptosporangium aurantiacum]|uniref:Succinyl-diaminopimelate desuccinylase n=1 Tax=Cryptosporangium aurantiacum TaxID=134849 RepID=A0A1M7QQY5_9ACTN|nr:succinyl-diaminopimelate desuccinylase [Cryptosporangium aurantiacum]SHN33656.1 succinyldiaminopimelate desuccinylase [Cryptosporangium aurantiacum]
MPLDLAGDPVALTTALVDFPSVSGDEGPLADAVETALEGLKNYRTARDGDTIVARTELGKKHRIVLAGHLDTVPIVDNVPSRRDGDLLYGCGASDMKSGLAVLLHLAATIDDPAYDLTLVCYDNEEVEAVKNGLGRVSRNHPDWLAADFAVLLEPTDGTVEGGCQGTLRAKITTHGKRAHSARSWFGVNAIHRAAEILDRLNTYQAREVDIDGCLYREGLNAVRIEGGVAGNVIPDRCDVTVNFRFAPDRTEKDAEQHVREVFEGYAVEVTDSAPGALPGLNEPAAARFVEALQAPVQAKLGWTDVARFATLGIPAVNFGPGDPNLAHQAGEYVDVRKITDAASALRRYLTAG